MMKQMNDQETGQFVKKLPNGKQFVRIDYSEIIPWNRSEIANELKKYVSRIAAFSAGYYLLPDSQNMLHQKANAGNSDPAA